MENSVVSAIKSGHADQVVDVVEMWIHTPDPKLSAMWDVRVGNMMWTRCVSGDIIDTVELESLLKLFRFVIIKYFAAENEFIIRLKAISVLLKFFIAKNKIVITDLGEKILHHVFLNYESIEDKDKDEFYAITSAFYGVLWNMMRENVSKLDDSISLQIVSHSIQFLMYNLPEKLETVAGKLYQSNSVVLGCNKVETVISFLEDLVFNSEKILKQVFKKKKPSKKQLNIVHFESFCQIVFTVSRYLIANLEFDKARKLYRILISSWKGCFPTDLLEALSAILEFYLKINEFIICPNKDLTNLSDLGDFLASKLNKGFETKHGGFRFVLLYTFAESIWHCMLHAFKKSELVTCDETESNMFEDFIGSFTNFAVSLESLPVGTYKGTLIGKRQEIEINLLMLPMRFFSDRVNKKEIEVTSVMSSTVEACYSKVMSVCSDIPTTQIKMITENYNRMCHCSSQIAFGYQKRKMYSMSLFWCLKGESSLQALSDADSTFESAINPCTLSVLIADCNRHLEQPEEGLKSMALMLFKNKSLMDTPSSVYDLYESPAWNDWNNHWNQLKRDLYHQDPSKVNKTVVDYILEDGCIEIDEEFKRDALRHEINSYFTNRQAIPEAMLSVGEQLEDLSENYKDRTLGRLSQIVAIWWSDETQIDSAISLCQEALDGVYKSSKQESKNLKQSGDVFKGFDDEFYDKQCYDSKQDKKRQDDKNKDNIHSVFEDDVKQSCGDEDSKQARCSTVLLLSALVKAWAGLCIWRKNTGIAERDVTEYYDICEQRREKIRQEGLDEEEACAESDHAYVGNTKLTFEDEMIVVDHFLKAIDGLYLLIQFGDTVKQLFDATCPALIMCTSRLVSHLMLTFGHSMYAIKSWQVTYFLAKIYNRKGLTVLCASELLKLVCNPEADYVQEATEINENAQSSNSIKNYKGLYYRLHLAHAVACYHNKSFELGAAHLSKVLFETEKLENEQFTSFIRGEALLVFALYKRSAATNGCKLTKVYDTHIMSPCDLFEDGYRTLTELNREVDIINSGWTDMYHNYLLFSTLLHNADTIIGYFQEAGLQFEVRSAATEIVNQALSFGCVSRAVQMLTYLATEDLIGKNFNHCIAKFDIINKSMQKLFPHHRAHSSEKIKEFVKEKLSMPSLNIKRLEDQKEVRWNLKLIVSPDETVDDELSNSDVQEEIQSQPFTPQPFTPYSFFLHPFNCYCYICTHPYIIPDALKFLHLQAKYSIGTNNPKKCLVLFEVAKRYHLRAMFRLMYNGDRIREKMFLNKKDAQAAYKVIYSPFFTEPSIHRLALQMEATPSENLENMICTMDEYVDLLKLKDPNDIVAMSIPYEILCSAVMDLDELKLLKTDSMCRCTPLEASKEIDVKCNDSKLKKNKKIVEVEEFSENEDEEQQNFKYLEKYRELNENDEKSLSKITAKLANMKIGINGGNEKNDGCDLFKSPQEMEIVPTSPEEKVATIPGKLEAPKIPKKGLKTYAVQSKDSHNPFAKPKAFTVYEDFDTPPHPKSIPFSVPLVDLETSDHEKENEELDNKKVTIRRPRRAARPEIYRGKDSGSSNKGSN